MRDGGFCSAESRVFCARDEGSLCSARSGVFCNT
jgi:hypothetical protein